VDGAPPADGAVADLAADAPASAGPLSVTRTRAEYRENPVGIDVARPRLDWLLTSAIRDQRQTAYEILVATTAAGLQEGRGDLWATGKVASDQSIQVLYEGQPLQARQRAWWKVRAWDKDGVPSAWSAPAFWEMGLLAATDWKAKWIASPAPATGLDAAGVSWIWFPEGEPLTAAPAGDRYFRRTFAIPAGVTVRAATCTLAADNELELFVNGTRVGAATDWHDVRAFDVRALLTAGTNVLAVRARNVDGPAGLAVSLAVTFAAGAPLTVVTNQAWRASNAVAAGWQAPAYDDTTWQASKELTAFGGAPWGRPGGGSPPAYLRAPFVAKAGVTRARVHATALGLYELWLNGARVGDDRLTPGWTDYRKRVQVQTYDVTSLVTAGDNALGAILADGWYGGKVGFAGRGHFFGDAPNRLLAQLEIDYADGTRQTVASDGTWKAGDGPILAADLLDGETYDARLEIPGWATAGFADAAWAGALVLGDASARRLVADATAGVRVTQELVPTSVKELRPGVFIFDLAQNMVGWTRLRAQATAGATVTLRFAEVLNADGSLYTTNLRGARATDTYTFRGGAVETFEPRFTTHGFRYVELAGDTAALAAKPGLTTLTGIVAHSATPPTGELATSSSMIDRLQSNIVWGQRGNFVSVPTDCPQRDERLGWMGDAQIFARTSTFNMDVASFFTKWMRDVVDAQQASGAFSETSPNPGFVGVGTPAWGDAGVIVPWTMYLAYGDTRILDEHYAAMAKWIDYVRRANPNFLWLQQRGSNYGDWLSIDANSEQDKDIVSTAFYAHSVDLMARAARVLGKDADAQTYGALLASIKDAFNKAYVGANGALAGGKQTSYTLALRFDLLPANLRAAAAKLLADDVVKRGHLSTGFIGVAHLLPALTSEGKLDVAYQLLETDTYPSWLYEIKRGATTIWERWDGITAAGGFQDPGMNSFNHYSFGAVGEWMYSTIAGIELDEARPAFKHVIIRPRPGGSLTSGRGSLLSSYGRIATDWTLAANVFTLSVTVPVNATASVYLPFSNDVRRDGAAATPDADGSYRLGSGTYVFTAAR
jgi:alpha-L-rhamnosidase